MDCRGHEYRSPSDQLISTSFPEKNECSGTNCSLTVQEERTVPARETEVKGKTKERTGWRESDGGRRDEKWQTYWCYRDQQIACRMAMASAEKLGHTGSAEKEWPQFHNNSSSQIRQSLLCRIEKEQSHLSRSQNREESESQGE